MSSTTTETPAPVFDRESVLDMVDGDIEFMQEMIEMLLDDLPMYREKLSTAVANRDATTIYQTAHRLKSSVGNLGGRDAHAAVISLEHCARSGDLSDVEGQYASCQEKLDRFETKLKSVLAEG